MDRTPDFHGFAPVDSLNFTLDGAQSLNLQAFLSSRQADFNAGMCEVDQNASKNQQDLPCTTDVPVISSNKPVTFQNLKDLVQESKDRFITLNPDDERWPCPFCMHFSQTKVQCRCHISRNHPNAEKLLYQDFVISDQPFCAPTSTVDDLPLTSFGMEDPSVMNQAQNGHNNIVCTRCVGSSKTFKGIRGLKQHYSHFHKDFTSDFDQPHQFQKDQLQQAAAIPSQATNDVICQRCPDNKKFYKGIRGLRIHYGLVHKDYLSELSHATTSSLNVNPRNLECDTNQFVKELLLYRKTIRVLKRVPKGARIATAKKLEELINSSVTWNDLQSWINLLSFSYRVLQVPKRSSKKNKLAAIIKKNILNFDGSPVSNNVKPKTASLAKRVEMKISDGDVRGAVKIVSSNDVFAPQNPETLEQLRAKHPSPPRPFSMAFPPIDSTIHYITNETEVHKAIFNFPNGSASGIDGLRPQILKDLLSKESGEIGNKLLLATTKLCNLMLEGKVCESIIPVLYGASLCALIKDDGGLRPIAIGVTFRRLTAKIGGMSIREPIGEYLRPHQLGFASKGGCEAAIHASRSFLVRNHGKAKVLLKIDFKNAFNSISREDMLQSILEKAPGLFPFLWQCYAGESYLLYGDDMILSQMGAQQGDPLGPLLFCLVIQPMIESLSSELNVWYLDDGTVAGEIDAVLSDFSRIIDFGKQIGLEVNPTKCELYFCSAFDQTIYDKFAELSPGIQVITSDLHLLGAPLIDSSCEMIFNKKFIELQTMFTRLEDLNHHIAYFLLKHCFAIPKLTFLLRASPIWKFPELISRFDDLISKTLQKILNVNLSNEKNILASLPVRNGGVGIRRVQDLAIPSFLSSIIGVSELICTILPSIQTDFSVVSGFDETLRIWNSMCPDTLPPTQLSSQHQWDAININRLSNSLVFNSDADMARFKASLCKESSAWLTVLPSKHLNTLLDNNSFRIAVALRLGCDICHPHICVCGDFVDSSGIHGLSCGKSAGRFYRHRLANEILKRTFNTAEIPARLEPSGLCRNDGKRPDGITQVPWDNGQILVWDFTCWDSLAPSYVKKSASNARSVANMAARRKRSLYSDIINQNYLFIPFACETLGPWCQEFTDIVNVLGSLVRQITGEPRSTSFIIQKLSIIIQRSNAACIMGSLPETEKLDEIYFLL